MDKEEADRQQEYRYYESLVEIKNQINHPKIDQDGRKKVFMLAFIEPETAITIKQFMIHKRVSFSQAIEIAFMEDQKS